VAAGEIEPLPCRLTLVPFGTFGLLTIEEGEEPPKVLLVDERSVALLKAQAQECLVAMRS
jgi:hypothetical protein